MNWPSSIPDVYSTAVPGIGCSPASGGLGHVHLGSGGDSGGSGCTGASEYHSGGSLASTGSTGSTSACQLQGYHQSPNQQYQISQQQQQSMSRQTNGYESGIASMTEVIGSGSSGCDPR
ncbi:unnamed protein product [Protopolystoma xenopodis]|uniref:Uncharacterized protein n=1 Tax=Protopolystoma xenopodis TaxID=117903 RepID=A0A448XK63_9PLAT|nr:unnamed protein product [Protopolystoma xenopodis]